MRHKVKPWWVGGLPTDSPVEVERKAGLIGKGDWPGFAEVYRTIATACERMATNHLVRLSDIHVDTMADLGSGHEERMKYRLMWLREYGWV